MQALQEEIQSRVAPDKDWKEIVNWAADMPPLPQVAAQAMTMIEDPKTTATHLAELLGRDTALASGVLKIANSAMFSRQREISTLGQAITTIGLKALQGIVLAATLRGLNRKTGMVEKLVWENSTCTAVAARIIGKKLKRPYVEELFLIGLLHDLGKLVLAGKIPESYQAVVTMTTKGKSFVDAEQAELGFSHSLIGALVAKKWNFSLETCEVILRHHDEVKDASRNGIDEKAAIIQAADLMTHVLGFGHPEGYPDCRPAAMQTMAKLGFDAAGIHALEEEIRNEASLSKAVLG
jgi:HD-like signal output (HDOD) protein